MTEEEKRIEDEALEFIKHNKKLVLDTFCPPSLCHAVTNPVSLFMAGSPGAGKTEVSKGLVRRFRDTPVRIDADEIRSLCPSYLGGNAHLFQKAANKGVNFLYDYALDKEINCIMDSTFIYAGASENIERSLKHGRKIEIWFIYQDPIRAWEFTKAREVREARRISKEVFINAFFESRANVRIVKDMFGKNIELNILIKNYAANEGEVRLNVPANELDRLADDRYSVDVLTEILV